MTPRPTVTHRNPREVGTPDLPESALHLLNGRSVRRPKFTWLKVGDALYAELLGRGRPVNINGHHERWAVETVTARLLAPGRVGRKDYEEGAWVRFPLSNDVLRDALGEAEIGSRFAYSCPKAQDWRCGVEAPYEVSVERPDW